MTDARNNVQFKTTGTIRATVAIQEGTEILMAYGADYWRGMRGVPATAQTRGEPRQWRGGEGPAMGNDEVGSHATGTLQGAQAAAPAQRQEAGNTQHDDWRAVVGDDDED